MTETIEQLCQRTMEARGYVVLCIGRPAKIGERVEFVRGRFWNLNNLSASMVVIAATDFHDGQKQADLWGVGPVDPSLHYYRVIAE